MSKPVLLDGAAGTLLWSMAEKNSVPKVPVWHYNIEHPEFILELNKRYINAGCEMLQTNTFMANRPEIEKTSEYTPDQVISAAVNLAKESVKESKIPVYASFGPMTTLLSPLGALSESECEEYYSEMCESAYKSGVDYIVFETFMDVRMASIAVKEAKKTGLPVICSMTFQKNKKTFCGNTIPQICHELANLGIDGIGMNCSLGPVESMAVIREFHNTTDLPLYFKPNSGIGNEYTPKQFAAEVEPSFEYVSYIGGCCGCDDSYIRELSQLLSRDYCD